MDTLRFASNLVNSCRAITRRRQIDSLCLEMPCVGEWRGGFGWRSTRDGLYIALFSFHLREVPPSAAFTRVICSPASLVRTRACVC